MLIRLPVLQVKNVLDYPHNYLTLRYVHPSMLYPMWMDVELLSVVRQRQNADVAVECRLIVPNSHIGVLDHLIRVA